MSVKEREEVIDLDFTYGDDFVHIIEAGTGKRYCRTPRNPNSPHRSHGIHHHPGEPTRSHCVCGMPYCPVCIHEREMKRRGITP